MNFMRRTWLLQLFLLTILIWGFYEVINKKSEVYWFILAIIIYVLFEIQLYYDFKDKKELRRRKSN